MAREDKKPAAEPPAAKPKKKLLLIVAAAVIASALAGGGAWYFMKGKPAGDEKSNNTVSAVPIFVPLDPFTVNLQREQGDQVLQVGLSLKIYNAELPEKIKAAMPEIRSSLLLLLSSKHASELVSVAGKKKLANEIIVALDTILGIAAPPAPQPATVATPSVATPAAPATTPAGEAAAATPAPSADATAAPVQGPAEAAAPAPASAEAKPAAEPREGIVGVLFTSFIIQ